jgi:hypothetical protein
MLEQMVAMGFFMTDNNGRNKLQQLTYEFFRWQFKVDWFPGLVEDQNNAKCSLWNAVKEKTGIEFIPCTAYEDHLLEQGKVIPKSTISASDLASNLKIERDRFIRD